MYAHSHFTDEADFEVDFAKYLNSIGCRNEIYNVGCMYWDYEPVTLDEIIERGQTVRPNYGERSSEYTMQFPWEKRLSIYPKQLRSEVMYYFWSKCEWEVLISPWTGDSGNEERKVDVCWQIMNNWDVFVDYVWANRRKL